MAGKRQCRVTLSIPDCAGRREEVIAICSFYLTDVLSSPSPCQFSMLLRSLLHGRINFQAQKEFVCLYTCAIKEVSLLLMPVGWLTEFFSIYKNAKCLKWESNDNIIRILSWGQMRRMAAFGGCVWVQLLSSKFVSYLFPFLWKQCTY